MNLLNVVHLNMVLHVMRTKNNKGTSSTNGLTHKLISTEKELQYLFNENKYLEVISKVNKIEKLLDEEFLDFYYFNNKISCLIYLGLSYFQLGNYENAKMAFLKVSNKVFLLVQAMRYWKRLAKIPINQQLSDIAQNACSLLKEQFDYFNKTNYFNYLSNLAYTFYKLEEYELSVQHYKKALKVYYKKCKKGDKDKNIEMQLHLGIAEAQYYQYRNIVNFKFLNKKTNQSLNKIINEIIKKNIPKNIKDNYHKTIKMLEDMGSSFDTLLALGKMYYFLGKYDRSISYLQMAISFSVENKCQKEIYAFDWLSRIAYKTKRHEIAVDYYKKIIDSLITVSIKNEKTIHPYPELHKMFKYLNQNKEATLKHDVHYINKSIWGGIFAGILFESAEILSSQDSLNPFLSPANIVIIMICLVLLSSCIYINVYK